MGQTKKPLASLSLDLDDQWTYMKTHGDPEWEQYPSYLSYAVPRILDFLDEKKTKITFFIVAQDAAFEHNREVLGDISRRGHEIGNHTFHHDPWLHKYSEEEINDELARA
ncbi:MAG: polysaccharide deacetylase family protein, partial [Bacteroidia bacterium]